MYVKPVGTVGRQNVYGTNRYMYSFSEQTSHIDGIVTCNTDKNSIEPK